MVKFWRRRVQQDTRTTQPAHNAQPAPGQADLAAWAREADVSRLSSQAVREAEYYLNTYRHMNLELSQQMGWRVMAAIEAQVTPSPPPFAQPLDVIATVLALWRKQPGTGLSSLSALALPSLGYEPNDVHLCRLARSPVTAVTLAHGWRMFASRSGRLRCVAALWRVSCTDSCTHLVLGCSASGCGVPSALVQGRSCRVRVGR